MRDECVTSVTRNNWVRYWEKEFPLRMGNRGSLFVLRSSWPVVGCGLGKRGVGARGLDLAGSVLTLRLFGGFGGRIDDVPIGGLHLREGERLLAYLVLQHGAPQTYRSLARLFWPSEANQNEEYEGGDY